MLCDHGADASATTIYDGVSSLTIACQEGHSDVVRELLERGGNVNAGRKSDNMTLLMWACVGGHLEVARLLLAHHASKTAVDKYGRTPYLHTPADHAELKELVKP